MKKLLSIMLLLSLLFSMAACQKDESDVPTPQEPTNVGYVPYQMYYFATLSLYDEFPLPEKCLDDFSKYNFNFYGTGYIRETAQSFPSFVLSMNGADYSCQPAPHDGIDYHLYTTGLVPLQLFSSRNGMYLIEVYVNNNDGSIVNISNPVCGPAETRELNMKEREALVENFIKTLAPDVDLSAYSLNVTDYDRIFSYEKRCGGLLTSDFIKVTITDMGGIRSYCRGESIDMDRLLEIGVDRERIEQVIDAYVTQVSSQYPELSLRKIIWDDFRIITLEDGTYAVCGTLEFYLSTSHKCPQVGILIPIGK